MEIGQKENNLEPKQFDLDQNDSKEIYGKKK